MPQWIALFIGMITVMIVAVTIARASKRIAEANADIAAAVNKLAEAQNEANGGALNRIAHELRDQFGQDMREYVRMQVADLVPTAGRTEWKGEADVGQTAQERSATARRHTGNTPASGMQVVSAAAQQAAGGYVSGEQQIVGTPQNLNESPTGVIRNSSWGGNEKLGWQRREGLEYYGFPFDQRCQLRPGDIARSPELQEQLLKVLMHVVEISGGDSLPEPPHLWEQYNTEYTWYDVVWARLERYYGFRMYRTLKEQLPVYVKSIDYQQWLKAQNPEQYAG